MSDESLTAAALRRQFDESFAEPPRARAEASQRLLTLRIGREDYAFRLDEVAGFVAARKIVPLASSVPGALGLAGIRGSLVPVYSLATLLGQPAEADGVRWFVLGHAPDPIALAFARFDRYLEVVHADVHLVSGAAARGLVPSVVSGAERAFGVISISALMETIRASCAGHGAKEP